MLSKYFVNPIANLSESLCCFWFFKVFILPSYFLKNSIFVLLYLFTLELEEVYQGPRCSLTGHLVIGIYSNLSINAVLCSFASQFSESMAAVARKLRVSFFFLVFGHAVAEASFLPRDLCLAWPLLQLYGWALMGFPPGLSAGCKSPAVLPAFCLI